MFVHKWYGNLSNRAIYVTILLCLVLLYVSYSFNACLVARINRVFANPESTRTGSHPRPGRPAYSRQSDGPAASGVNDVNKSVLRLFGSFVRIVPLTGNDTAIQPYFANNPPIHGHPFNAAANAANINQAKYPAAAAAAANSPVQPDADASPKYRFLRQQALRPNRHLPHALIIGVKKSGTRALLEFIRLHPDVRAAGCEVHYFDRHYAKGLPWYRAHMPPTIDGQVTMEKTPSYFVTREVPARVHRMNPAVRLLVVVRDPVTRAISDYTQAASKKPDMRRFEDLAFPNGTDRAVDTNWGPLRIGVYARHLEWWLQYFPVGQLLFISGERLIVDPAFEMGRVQDFLGLKRVVTEKHFYFNSTKGFPCLFKSEARSSPHCLGKTKGRNHPYIDPTAVDRLRDFYRPYNARFYQMTGINFGWL